ncbi:hypothetical protein MC885_019666 [Smutsia gigantea]|nr:hypothetical protein MC885_019666 [Smutsia gigantea]
MVPWTERAMSLTPKASLSSLLPGAFQAPTSGNLNFDNFSAGVLCQGLFHMEGRLLVSSPYPLIWPQLWSISFMPGRALHGIADDYDKEKLVKAFKKKFTCNGTVNEHAEYGEVTQVQALSFIRDFIKVKSLVMRESGDIKPTKPHRSHSKPLPRPFDGTVGVFQGQVSTVIVLWAHRLVDGEILPHPKNSHKAKELLTHDILSNGHGQARTRSFIHLSEYRCASLHQSNLMFGPSHTTDLPSAVSEFFATQFHLLKTASGRAELCRASAGAPRPRVPPRGRGVSGEFR